MSDAKTAKQQGERLQDFRKRAGFRSAREAALNCGWKESTYRAHENGTRTIGLDDAERYAKRFKLLGVNVTAREILFGIDTHLGRSEFDIQPTGNEHLSDADVAAGLAAPMRPSSEELTGAGRVKELDVRAGMGGGGLVGEAFALEGGEMTTVDAYKPDPWIFPDSFVRGDLRSSPQKLLIMEAAGDSMVPTIPPNARVLVNTAHTVPSPDGVYALRDQFGLVVVKRLHVTRTKPPRLKIISDNKSHPEDEVELEEVSIVGKVVASIHVF